MCRVSIFSSSSEKNLNWHLRTAQNYSKWTLFFICHVVFFSFIFSWLHTLCQICFLPHFFFLIYVLRNDVRLVECRIVTQSSFSLVLGRASHAVARHFIAPLPLSKGMQYMLWSKSQFKLTRRLIKSAMTMPNPTIVSIQILLLF